MKDKWLLCPSLRFAGDTGYKQVLLPKLERGIHSRQTPISSPFSLLLPFPRTTEWSGKPSTSTRSISLRRQASAAEHHIWNTLSSSSCLICFLFYSKTVPPEVTFYKLRPSPYLVRGQSRAGPDLHKKELIFNWIRILTLTFEKHTWRHFDLMGFAY